MLGELLRVYCLIAEEDPQHFLVISSSH